MPHGDTTTLADRADGGVEVDAPLPPTIDGLYVDGWQLWAQETGTTVALSKMILRSFRSPSLNNTIRILSTGKAGGFELKPERENYQLAGAPRVSNQSAHYHHCSNTKQQCDFKGVWEQREG